VSAESDLQTKFEALAPFMGEMQRRMWAATEAQLFGRGGVAAVHRATGIAKSTILRGLADVESGRAEDLANAGRVRAKGAGRKLAELNQAGLSEALDRLIDPQTRGDPESVLRWTSKSTTKLAGELRKQGFSLSADTVGRLLRGSGYSLQSTRKRLEGASHSDRNEQFERISALTKTAKRRQSPVISVDTKKKELVGRFSNAGREWQPSSEPEAVNVHDFPVPGQGKAIPYGIYDVGRNEGFVSVGITADTAEFAVASIRLWWRKLGRRRYAHTRDLLITADCGGSNSYRCRLWKVQLQAFADETGLRVRVAHYPPGTSKWNKIEHRLFCQITTNWRGRPLTSYQTVVDLIGATKTNTGLKVYAHLDTRSYKKGREVSDAELETIRIKRDTFHGEWNYVFVPRS
jgi:transposase